jgi:hypothetical protein
MAGLRDLTEKPAVFSSSTATVTTRHHPTGDTETHRELRFFTTATTVTTNKREKYLGTPDTSPTPTNAKKLSLKSFQQKRG